MKTLNELRMMNSTVSMLDKSAANINKVNEITSDLTALAASGDKDAIKFLFSHNILRRALGLPTAEIELPKLTKEEKLIAKHTRKLNDTMGAVGVL